MDEQPTTPETSRTDWHTAFFEAIQVELEAYRDALQFTFQHQLTTEPLRIDVLIIKKTKDVEIKKNIAAIFRDTNIIEYKSPEDYVSIDDFYKVYGYACLYAALNKTAITDLTLTFVESRYPRDLLAHLREVRQYEVAENSPGIYSISGDILPIQIIDSRKLSADENLWLKDLDNQLAVAAGRRLAWEIERQGKAEQLKAYMYAVTRANAAVIEEVAKMSSSALEFEQALEKVGWTAKWEARGEARGRTEGETRGEAKVLGLLKKTGYDTTKLEEALKKQR